MLTDQELREKIELFLVKHADICYRIEEQRQKELKRARVVIIILLSLTAGGMIAAYFYPVILAVLILVGLPAAFLFMTPYLSGKKPMLVLNTDLQATLIDQITQFLYTNLQYQVKNAYFPSVRQESTHKKRQVMVYDVISGEVANQTVYFCTRAGSFWTLFEDAGEEISEIFMIELSPFRTDRPVSEIAQNSSVNRVLAKLYPLFSNRIPVFRQIDEDKFQVIGPLEKTMFPIYKKMKIYNPDTLLPIFKQIYYLFQLVEVLDREVNAFKR